MQLDAGMPREPVTTPGDTALLTAPAHGDPTRCWNDRRGPAADPAPAPTTSRRAEVTRFVRFGAVGVVNTATYYGTYLAVHLVAPYLAAHA